MAVRPYSPHVVPIGYVSSEMLMASPAAGGYVSLEEGAAGGVKPSTATVSSEMLATIDELENKILERARHRFPAFFSTFKKEHLWKLLFMERDKISEGKYAYESKEEGYLRGIMNGYLYMLLTCDDVLTPGLYVQLHDEGAKGVKSSEEPDGIPLGFRNFSDGKEAFGLKLGDTLSRRGVEELIARYNTYCYTDDRNVFFPLQEALDDPSITILEKLDPTAVVKPSPVIGKLKPTRRAHPADETSPSIKLKPTRPPTCEVNANFVIDIYKTAKKDTEEQKLRAIARLCQDLDQFHLFVDGNIRTTGILILNRLLLTEGLCPCIMRDVNQLDCLSEDEIIALIREGQGFFKALAEEPSGARTASTTAGFGSTLHELTSTPVVRPVVVPLHDYVDILVTLQCRLSSGIHELEQYCFEPLSVKLREERALEVQHRLTTSSSSRLEPQFELIERKIASFSAELLKRPSEDSSGEFAAKVQEISSSLVALKARYQFLTNIDAPSMDIRNKRNLEDSLQGMLAHAATSKAEAGKLWEYAGFFIESVENYLVKHAGDTPEALRGVLEPYLIRFEELMSHWKLENANPLQRLYYRVYEIAHDENPDVGGDSWGERNAFGNAHRLGLALQITKEEFSRFDYIA